MDSNLLMNLLVSVFVPIIVALISSDKVANRVTKRIKIDDLSGKVEKLDKTVTDLDNKFEINKADTYRTRILRFNGEVKRGTKHDEEEFNDVIDAIDAYEVYCQNHPEYHNNKCSLAIENVKRVYKECLQNNSF